MPFEVFKSPTDADKKVKLALLPYGDGIYLAAVDEKGNPLNYIAFLTKDGKFQLQTGLSSAYINGLKLSGSRMAVYDSYGTLLV
jgi:hypothetical protein